jgi:NAD(P)-dependent dehydrogenase (short-subunit alcohol dehydrogenase family)
VAQREPRAGRVVLVADALAHRGQINELLAAGWAVAALDADPMVATLASTPGYLGLRADAEDAADRARVLDAVVRAFGGIDLILAPSSWDALFNPLLEYAIP